MATPRSPVVTRSHVSAAAEHACTEARDSERQSEILKALLEEMRLLRESQARREEEQASTLRRHEEELRRLQLSLSVNRAAGEVASVGESAGREGAAGDGAGAEVGTFCESRESAGLGLKLKPDIFDGSVPLREYLSQFSLIARANSWDDARKSIALAASLRGKARSVLESIENLDEMSYEELKSKLELRFGDSLLSQNYYSLFTSRKQRRGEDYASFGAELERLSHLAYPECSFSVREKIACAQFVSALADNFVRRTLQLEGVSSLKLAIERAKAVKIIQESNFVYERRYNSNFKNNFEGKKVGDPQDGKDQGEKRSTRAGKDGRGLENLARDPRECWTCGKTGHFRADCPEGEGN